MIHVKITLFICLSLILCACTFHEQYPTEWAPLVKPSKDCWTTITGTYNDDGPRTKPSLGYLLTGIVATPNPDKTYYIQISKGDNGALIVTVWTENIKLAEKIYKKDDYACTNEGIEISKGMYITPEWVLGLSRDKFTLIRAGDGSLVIMHESGGFGLLGALIPVAVDEIKYYKYSQKK